MKIRAIPITDLLDALHELYDMGVDYIDVEGTENRIDISFIDEYIDPEYLENFEEEDKTVKVSSKLTDDDFKDLI